MFNIKVFSLLNQIAILFPVFLIIFTFKGFIQALTAKLMGDRTAEKDGFLSLNPLAHVDLIGLIIILFGYLIIGLIFTDPLPSSMFFVVLVTFGARMIIPVTVNDRNFKNLKWGGVITALAGSIGNFILAAITVFLLKVLIISPLPHYALVSLMGILAKTLDVAILFGLLDLIPLPPFDSGKMLRYIIPPSKQYIVSWLEDYSFFIFLFLFFAPVINNYFFGILSMASTAIKIFLLGLII